MIKLKAFETGESVYIDPFDIRCIIQHPAGKMQLMDGSVRDIERHSRIYFGSSFSVLVADEADAVWELFNDATDDIDGDDE